jgi:molybdopterin molybdotransferase
MAVQVQTLDEIAASLQGYDSKALSADAVLAFLSRLVTPVTEVAELPLFEALGRVLAEDVVSPFDVPPHARQLGDGRLCV